MFDVNIYERYFGQLEKVWWNIKGKRTKECTIWGKKKIMIVLGKGVWRLLFLFLEFLMFMCMYVLGLIKLELSLKLWFWLNNENDRRSTFQYLKSYVYVFL